MKNEKQNVAGISVVAAIFLTSFKLVIGIITGSLGLLSEALHSGLDLVAAVITWFSVRISDRPPDADHQYGHGKIENFSALIETILLLITCGWIIYEAINRLVTGHTHIEVNIFSYLVVIISIFIDYGRSRALARVAKKFNSQALEADALHFSTDIWSSSVVLLGLICAQFGYHFADSLAALGVAIIVLSVSYRLGKRAVDVLMDKSPADLKKKVESVLNQTTEITHFHDVKVRTSGADIFVEVNIHVTPGLTIEQAHDISHSVEKRIKMAIQRCEIHIHIEPEEDQRQSIPVFND
ncbi:MAG: cation diffusion facilitator family transporter [Bacteroidales bacterium]|jgi:cation diffusion facilitator family transporter|nr:cation diffusion facilitator family transporter [Bacteroidales bacterium]